MIGFVDKCKDIRKDWSEEDKENFLQEAEEINTAFVMAIQKKLGPSSNEEYIGLCHIYKSPKMKTAWERLTPNYTLEVAVPSTMGQLTGKIEKK